jgi:hypothetical protein
MTLEEEMFVKFNFDKKIFNDSFENKVKELFKRFGYREFRIKNNCFIISHINDIIELSNIKDEINEEIINYTNGLYYLNEKIDIENYNYLDIFPDKYTSFLMIKKSVFDKEKYNYSELLQILYDFDLKIFQSYDNSVYYIPYQEFEFGGIYEISQKFDKFFFSELKEIKYS